MISNIHFPTCEPRCQHYMGFIALLGRSSFASLYTCEAPRKPPERNKTMTESTASLFTYRDVSLKGFFLPLERRPEPAPLVGSCPPKPEHTEERPRTRAPNERHIWVRRRHKKTHLDESTSGFNADAKTRTTNKAHLGLAQAPNGSRSLNKP